MGIALSSSASVRSHSYLPHSPAFVPDLISHTNADAEALFSLEQLEVSFEELTGTLWSFMRPLGRPSYNPGLLQDFHGWQRGIQAMFADRPNELNYLVLGSRVPRVFNLGGDLDLFVEKIHQRDRQALVDYGNSCVQILHRNMNSRPASHHHRPRAGRRTRRRL